MAGWNCASSVEPVNAVVDVEPQVEVAQHRRAVITDSRESKARALENWQIALQLDQLPPAVHSPIGRAKKHQYQAIWCCKRSAIALLAILNLEPELRRGRSGSETDIGCVGEQLMDSCRICVRE